MGARSHLSRLSCETPIVFKSHAKALLYSSLNAIHLLLLYAFSCWVIGIRYTKESSNSLFQSVFIFSKLLLDGPSSCKNK